MKKSLFMSTLVTAILFTVAAIAQQKAVVVPVNGYTVIPLCDGIIDCNGACNGTAYLNSCNICVDGNSDITFQYGCVTSAGQIWMDRNLGASRIATDQEDSTAYGDLYQWGRPTDGHEKRTSSTTETQSNNNVPGHGNFIIGSYDWLNPSDDNLWQDTGINNPCPTNFRLPTEAEWEIERQSWTSNGPEGAFASPLKLVTAGQRWSDGTIKYADMNGSYWSSTNTGGDNANGLHTYIGENANMAYSTRAYGLSVRCIKN